jgi:PAS domain S-box-containing protein
MAAKEPLRRIASLRQQLQDLASIGCCDPNLVFRTLKDASCDLQEIEEMLCHEKTDNFEDLSEYRRESENPREHDEIYKLLFDNARDGIVLHRLKSDGLPGEMLQVNDAMCKMLGYTIEELLRLTPMNLQEEGFEEASKERRRVLNHEKGILFERTLKAKDGRRIPVEIHSTLMDSHGTWGSLSVVRERTDRKNMEIYLQDSRDFLDKIINSIGDPIFVKDEQHRYILVNDAECGLIGHGREEIIGKNCYDFFPEEQARIFWERDKEVFETGREDINEELVTDAVRATHTVITKKTL